MRFAFTCFLASFIGLASAQPSPINDFVLAGETAYGMMGPETVAGGVTGDLQWSDDGKYLLAVRGDIGTASSLQSLLASGQKPSQGDEPGEQSIVAYSLADRKATVVWHEKSVFARVQEVTWFKGMDAAIAVVVERLRTTDPSRPDPTRLEALYIDVRAGTATQIVAVEQQGERADLAVVMSPTRPMGLITLSEMAVTQTAGRPGQWHMRYRIVSGNGNLGTPVNVDDGAFVGGWSEDGRSPLLILIAPGPNGKVSREVRTLDLDTGALTVAKDGKRYRAQLPSRPIDVRFEGGTVAHRDKKRHLSSAWLTTEQASRPDAPVADKAGATPAEEKQASGSYAMISSDTVLAVLSPTLSGVAYVSQGVAMVRPIIQMPKALFPQALKAAERAGGPGAGRRLDGQGRV